MGKEPHINGYAPEWPLRLGGNAQNQDLINLHQLVTTWCNLYQLGNEITRFAIRGLPGAYVSVEFRV